MNQVVPERRRRGEPLLDRLETLSVLGVVTVLAFLLSAAAFLRPTQQDAERSIPYRTVATFSYTADTAPDSIYGADGLRTGSTVVLDQVTDLDVSVALQLFADPEPEVTGEATLVATVTVDGGLRRTFPVATASLADPQADLAGRLPLRDIRAFYAESNQVLGLAGAAPAATVTLGAPFEVSGSVGGQQLQTSFAPVVDLALDEDTLGTAADPGQVVGAEDPVFNPSDSGRVEYVVQEPAQFSLLVAHPSVVAVRWFALVLGTVALLLLLVLALRTGGRQRGDEVARILAAHGTRIATTTSINLGDGPIADVASIQDLVEIAKRYEATVLHVPDTAGDAFVVWDNGLTYRYRAAATGDERVLGGDTGTDQGRTGASATGRAARGDDADGHDGVPTARS